MFFKQKLLFFIIQFIFCIFLVYFIDQQIILFGLFNNLFIDLIFLYTLIIFVAGILSAILTKIYITFLKLIKNKYNKQFIFWLLFTFLCYILTFGIFAIAIKY